MTDIAGERAALAAQGLDIRLREQWGATFDYSTDRACDVPAIRLFLHIADVDDPGDLLGTEDQVARNVERIGINRFPSTGISYNALIFNTGRLYEGQPLTRRGAHTVNDFGVAKCAPHGHPVTAPGSPMNLNVNARAIVLPQKCADPVNDAQVHGAARWAAAQKRAGYVARDALWCGHRCVAAKLCPCDHGFARIPEIEALTEQYTINGLEDALTPEDYAWLSERFSDIWDYLHDKFEKDRAGTGSDRLSDIWDRDGQILAGVNTQADDEANILAALASFAAVNAEEIATALVASGAFATPAQVQTALAEVLTGGTSSVPAA